MRIFTRLKTWIDSMIDRDMQNCEYLHLESQQTPADMVAPSMPWGHPDALTLSRPTAELIPLRRVKN